MEGTDNLFQNDQAGRSGLKELGGRIGNGPDQSLRLTAPPAVLYPGRGAIRWPPCTPQARCSTPSVKAQVLRLRPPTQVPPAVVALVEVEVMDFPQRLREVRTAVAAMTKNKESS